MKTKNKQNVVITLMLLTLIILILLSLITLKGKKQDNINAIEEINTIQATASPIKNSDVYTVYNRLEFDIGSGSLYIESEHNIGIILINGTRKSPDIIKSSNYIEFIGITDLFPRNELFYIDIHIYNDTLELVEKINLPNIYLCTDGNINEIEELENIECLRISQKGKAKVSDLYKINELKFLEISNNNIKANLKELAKLNNLVNLSINSVSIYGNLSDLTDIEHLESLQISDSYIYGNLNTLSLLKSLKSVKIIYTNNNNIGGGLADIPNSIESLKIYRSNSSWDIASLADNAMLKELVIIDCDNIYGELGDISNLFNLERIEIYKSPNIYGNLGSLSSMNLLKTIIIMSDSIGGDISVLSDNFKLRYIELESDNITGNVTKISNLENLVQCYTSGCPNVTGELNLPPFGSQSLGN